jgi:outer membrane protein TolC
MTVFPRPSYFREAFRNSDTTVNIAAPAGLNDFIKSGDACQAVVIKATAVDLTAGGAIGGADAAPAAPTVAPSQYPEKAPAQCLVLSLKDFLGLVMVNHTDVQTYYLNVERSRNNVTSVYGNWDPRGSLSLTPSWSERDPRLNDPSSSASKSASWPIGMSYSQTLSTGQSLSFSGGGSKSTAWGQNTSYASNMSFSVTQPLIKNRGAYITRIPLFQAQSNLKISVFSLRSNLLNLVNNAETAYWNLVSARESLKVTLTAMDVAKAQLDYIQHELDLGAVSNLEMYNPEASYAQSQVSVVTNEFSYKNYEDALRRQIGADIDSTVRNLSIVLTESPDLSPSEAIVPDRDQTVQKAMTLNPSIASAVQSLDADEYGLASARNGLLPQVDLRAGYGGSGAGSTYVPFFGGSVIPGGLGDALHQLFTWGNPGYNVGVTLTFPIRSRSASMSMANAVISKKQDALSLRSQQQNLRLLVVQAVNSFQGAIEQAKVQAVSRDYTYKNYDAQFQRFQLGMNQQLDLINASRDLATADQQLVNAKIAVRTSLLRLWLQTGELLEQRGIVVK